MSTFKDFVGINICIYDPSGTDIGAIGENTFGYNEKSQIDQHIHLRPTAGPHC
jgi:hypothetical protein